MNELITVNFDTQTVSARELHEKLNIGTRFTTWFERMCEYGFVQGKDFFPKLGETSENGGRPATDFDVTIRCAKEICMVQRTDIGKTIRNYLLDLEEAWNTPEQVMARALKIAQQTVDSLRDRCRFLGGQVVEQQKVIEEMQPKVSYYDAILQCKDLISVTVIAKDYGISAKEFNSMLHNLKIQFRQGDIWVLYAKYQGNGYMKTKTHNYVSSDGEQHSKEHSYWTQKGRLFLYEILKQNGVVPLMER